MTFQTRLFSIIFFTMLPACFNNLSAQSLVYRRNAIGGTDIYEQGREAYGPVGRMSKNALGETVVEDLRPAQNQRQVQTGSTRPVQNLYKPNLNLLQQAMSEYSGQRRTATPPPPTVRPQNSSASPVESDYEKYTKERINKLRSEPAQFRNFYNSFTSKPTTVKNGWHKVVRITRAEDGSEVCRFGSIKVFNNIPTDYVEQSAEDLYNKSSVYNIYDDRIVKQPISKCKAFFVNGENQGVPEEVLFIDYLISPIAGRNMSFNTIKIIIPADGLVVLTHSNGNFETLSKLDSDDSNNIFSEVSCLVETGNYTYHYVETYSDGGVKKHLKGTFEVIYDVDVPVLDLREKKDSYFIYR